MNPVRQSAVGLALAAAVLASWIAFHVWSIFLLRLEGPALLAAPLIVAIICWLNVGLFIVAHDCMHGSLAPGRPALNLWIGRVALGVYAGFSFDRLRPKHFEHHKHPGTADDPDFSAEHPRHFWKWYGAFLRQYFGLREFAILALLLSVYVFALGAPLPNVLLFWAFPAILSSLQLFLFGTFLPHRAADQPFADGHRARSNDFGWLASLLTCFHFGYHHEHHAAPHVPWWRLPGERIRRGNLASPR